MRRGADGVAVRAVEERRGWNVRARRDVDRGCVFVVRRAERGGIAPIELLELGRGTRRERRRRVDASNRKGWASSGEGERCHVVSRWWVRRRARRSRCRRCADVRKRGRGDRRRRARRHRDGGAAESFSGSRALRHRSIGHLHREARQRVWTARARDDFSSAE